jgi:hypothetical protein
MLGSVYDDGTEDREQRQGLIGVSESQLPDFAVVEVEVVDDGCFVVVQLPISTTNQLVAVWQEKL